METFSHSIIIQRKLRAVRKIQIVVSQFVVSSSEECECHGKKPHCVSGW